MPAYNEESNIRLVIEQWHLVIEKVGLNSRLVIFDDGSKDNTFKIMSEIRQDFPQLIPISKANSGHGDTLLFAYNYCIKANAEYVFQTDSDGQTDPNEFWSFWERRNDYDFIIGYRKKREDGISRKLVAHILKFLVLLNFKTYVKDPNTPFRLMRGDKLRALLSHIPAHFFLSNVILSMLIVKHKEKHLWMPITFKNRQGGINSINLKRIFKIGLNALGDFNKVKP
jgi:glycosyltransferase involved in cell wall biosynthesis